MLNIIWLTLIIAAVALSFINGTTDAVVASVTKEATFAFELGLGLAGIMIFWLGIMRIAEDSGLVQLFARFLRPILQRLFPEVPTAHPAMGAMLMNISANMLGLNNAATPFGLRAMEQLEKLNPKPGTATNAMCTFLAINTSSIQLIPTTAIAILAASGAKAPSAIIITALLATMCSTCAAVIAAKALEKWKWFSVEKSTASEVKI